MLTGHYVVVELGTPLGYAPYSQKLEISKRIQNLGGRVCTVVSEEVTIVVSRDVHSVEFEDSLTLQHAIKANIPIVTLDYIARLESGVIPQELSVGAAGRKRGGLALPMDCSKYLVKIPTRCIQKLRELRFTTLAKANDMLEVERYNELEAAACKKANSALPTGWPEWPLAVEPNGSRGYCIVREMMSGDAKVELHCVSCEGGVAVDGSDVGYLRPHYPYRVFLSVRGDPVGTGHSFFLSSSEAAEKCFVKHWKAIASGEPEVVTRAFGSIVSCSLLTSCIGSPDPLPESLSELMSALYKDSWIRLTALTTLDVDAARSSSLLEAIKAEALLMKMDDMLESNADIEALRQVTSDLRKIVPFGSFLEGQLKHGAFDRSNLHLAFDAVRCMKSLLSTGEACCGNVHQAPTTVQMAALNAAVREIPRGSVAFESMQHCVHESAHSSPSFVPITRESMSIRRIFEVSKVDDDCAFHREVRSLKDTTTLFHGTAAGNLVPILRSGLRLPSVKYFRRDAGMLGRGIYMGDSICTALKYSTRSAQGSVFVLVCSAALGKVYETRTHLLGIDSAPSGFDSVRGVSEAGSDFTENEYVIYRESQVKLSYLVELNINDELLSALQGNSVSHKAELFALSVAGGKAPTSQNKSFTPPSRWDGAQQVKEFEPPSVKKVEGGLRSSNGDLVPLRNTRIRARIVDLIAEVDVLQQYSNTLDKALETKYVFPLQPGCAVCGFEAYINDKKIVGKVKEKEEARREYKAAVERGDGAYLMDESEESPDVFTVTVGNLPPMTDVVIRITYVLELRVHPVLQAIEFIVPSAIIPSSEKIAASKVVTQKKTETTWGDASQCTVGIQVSLDMPFDILGIECSHGDQGLRRKRSATRAVLQSDDLDLVSRDFVMYVSMSSINTPRIWIEQHPTERSRTAMITFFPEVSLPSSDKRVDKDVLILLDCSASMGEGNAMEAAKQAVIMFLRSLPRHWRFNVVLFGSSPLWLFPAHVSASLTHIESCVQLVQSMAGPWLGGSCLQSLLYSVGSYESVCEGNLDVFLFSDGLIADGEESSLCLEVQRQTALRIFSFAVGKTSNSTSLRSLSRSGRGECEVLSDSVKSKWRQSAEAQVRRARQEGFSRIGVDWCTEESARLRARTNATVLQAPRHVSTLFSGESCVVFGIVKHNATQCEITAQRCGPNVSRDQYGYWPEQKFIVSANGMCYREGLLIHRLCTKARIREYTEGLLTTASTASNERRKDATKSEIIRLGCEYGLVTPFTSMIAVEERTADERQGMWQSRTAKPPTPSIDMVGQSVDVLPEQPFEDVLASDEESEAHRSTLQLSISSKQQKKQLLQEKKKKAEERRKRLEEDWVKISSVDAFTSNNIDGLGDSGAEPSEGECDDVDEGEGMMTRGHTTKSFNYESPPSTPEPSSSSESMSDDHGEWAAEKEDPYAFLADLRAADALESNEDDYEFQQEPSDGGFLRDMNVCDASDDEADLCPMEEVGAVMKEEEECDDGDDTLRLFDDHVIKKAECAYDRRFTDTRCDEQEPTPKEKMKKKMMKICEEEDRPRAQARESAMAQPAPASARRVPPPPPCEPSLATGFAAPQVAYAFGSMFPSAPPAIPFLAPSPMLAPAPPVQPQAAGTLFGASAASFGALRAAAASPSFFGAPVPCAFGGAVPTVTATSARPMFGKTPSNAPVPIPGPGYDFMAEALSDLRGRAIPQRSEAAAAVSAKPQPPAMSICSPCPPPKGGCFFEDVQDDAPCPPPPPPPPGGPPERPMKSRAAPAQAQQQQPSFAAPQRECEERKRSAASSGRGLAPPTSSLASRSSSSSSSSCAAPMSLKGDQCVGGGAASFKEKKQRIDRSVERSIERGECLDSLLSKSEQLMDMSDKLESAMRCVNETMSTSLSLHSELSLQAAMLESLPVSLSAEEALASLEQWSPAAIRISRLPTHFTSSLLPGTPLTQVGRCPSTGMCTGWAIVDYGPTAEEAVLPLVILCEFYGWEWSVVAQRSSPEEQEEMKREMIPMIRKAFEQSLDELIGKIGSAITAYGEGSAEVSDLLVTLDVALGLPPTAVWQLYLRELSLGDEVRNSMRLKDFLRAVVLAATRLSDEACVDLPECVRSLQRVITRHSSRYFRLHNIVAPVDLPLVCRSDEPFPFMAVQLPTARNYYE